MKPKIKLIYSLCLALHITLFIRPLLMEMSTAIASSVFLNDEAYTVLNEERCPLSGKFTNWPVRLLPCSLI